MYTSIKQVLAFYPLKYKKDSRLILISLIEMTGIPSGMHSDRAPDLIAGNYNSLLGHTVCAKLLMKVTLIGKINLKAKA